MLSKNFSRGEWACSHCGACNVHSELIDIVQSIRTRLNKPMFISSGYRCEDHHVEKSKINPGEHSLGMAVDIICHGSQALFILEQAQSLGVKRIGVSQKGIVSSRFIHLGIADRFTNRFKNAIWTY